MWVKCMTEGINYLFARYYNWLCKLRHFKGKGRRNLCCIICINAALHSILSRNFELYTKYFVKKSIDLFMSVLFKIAAKTYIFTIIKEQNIFHREYDLCVNDDLFTDNKVKIRRIKKH